MDASAGRWGNRGANGGAVILTANGQILAGDITADSLSNIAFILQNQSSWTGAINAEKTAQEVNLTLDASSSWTVTADSYLTSLSDASGISGAMVTNIIGNGYPVYSDASVCPELGGLTYALSGGGYLMPVR